MGSLVHLPVSGELGVQGLRAELGFHGEGARSRHGRGSSGPRLVPAPGAQEEETQGALVLAECGKVGGR